MKALPTIPTISFMDDMKLNLYIDIASVSMYASCSSLNCLEQIDIVDELILLIFLLLEFVLK